MSSFGPIHKLIVYDVGEPYGPLSTHEFAEYEIEHTDECKLVERTMAGVDGDKGVSWQEYDCALAWNAEQCGVRWSLHYCGTPIDEPGEYYIQAWAETIHGFDYTEYDGGIGLATSCPWPREKVA